MTAVSDASPLIWLAKTGKINLLRELFEEIVIPKEVYEEAVEEGLKHGLSDAIAINECTQQGWIKFSKLTPKDTNLVQRISQHAFFNPAVIILPVRNGVDTHLKLRPDIENVPSWQDLCV